jgi:hypothetical protein
MWINAISRRMLIVSLTTLSALVIGATSFAQQPKSRDELVRDDLANLKTKDAWIYNDVARGLAEAKQSGKPLLVVFRCVPCKACAQLDQTIVESNPELDELLKKFVCVRVVHANGLDLGLFQFDYDQSFAAFIMNGDKTIYGRYGTRSHQTESADDVALEGFVAALEAGLRVHAEYPANKSELVGKQSSSASPYTTPEQFPELAKRYGSKLDYEGKVAASCIHCHQVGEALFSAERDTGKPIREEVLFPYPHPKALGLIMDPKECGTVADVTAGSAAEQAGFRRGDEIRSLGGQPILSIGDMQWVLHHVATEKSLTAAVFRNGNPMQIELTLAPGWRARGDISWRAGSWNLRRRLMGGIKLDEAPAELRAEKKIPDDALALVAVHVGEYGDHALAKRRGFKKGDIITSIAGESKQIRETDLFALLINRPVGEEFPVTVLRGDELLELKLAIQK